MRRKPEPLRDRKAARMQAALELGREKPQGWTIGDLCSRLPRQTAGEVRGWLRSQAGTKVDWRALAGWESRDSGASSPEASTLRRVEAGLYVLDFNAEAVGPGVRIAMDLPRVSRELGGLFHFTTLIRHAGWGSRARLVRRALAESPHLRQGLPFPGCKLLWRDDRRESMPVPGHLLILDLRLTDALDAPQADLEGYVQARLEGVGAALRQAREAAGLTIPAVVGGAVGDALATALATCEREQDAGEGRVQRLADWWSEQMDVLGRREALNDAWNILEEAEQPYLAFATTVSFWDQVAEVFTTDGAALSRGSLVAEIRAK